MEDQSIIWKKISPAELSAASKGDFFAFAQEGKFFLVEHVRNNCLFTSVMLASSVYSCSLYNLDIWVGQKGEDIKGKIDTNTDIESIKSNLLKQSKKSNTRYFGLENKARINYSAVNS